MAHDWIGTMSSFRLVLHALLSASCAMRAHSSLYSFIIIIIIYYKILFLPYNHLLSVLLLLFFATLPPFFFRFLFPSFLPLFPSFISPLLFLLCLSFFLIFPDSPSLCVRRLEPGANEREREREGEGKKEGESLFLMSVQWPTCTDGRVHGRREIRTGHIYIIRSYIRSDGMWANSIGGGSGSEHFYFLFFSTPFS